MLTYILYRLTINTLVTLNFENKLECNCITLFNLSSIEYFFRIEECKLKCTVSSLLYTNLNNLYSK